MSVRRKAERALVLSVRLDRGIRVGVSACTYGPSRQNVRQRHDVGLRVSSIHTEGVQFHHLAGIVFIDAASLALGFWRCAHFSLGVRQGRDVSRVVEIDEHRRMFGRCEQKIAEATKNMRPNRLFFVGAYPNSNEPFLVVDVEVIEPEVDKRFLKLPRASHGTYKPCGLRFARHTAFASFEFLLLFLG